jgi:uncharacterized protein YuzE
MQQPQLRVLYLTVIANGVWARSIFPDELVTVDYDAHARVIGVEVVCARD